MKKVIACDISSVVMFGYRRAEIVMMAREDDDPFTSFLLKQVHTQWGANWSDWLPT